MNPSRSHAPKHFRWRSSTSFVEAIFAPFAYPAAERISSFSARPFDGQRVVAGAQGSVGGRLPTYPTRQTCRTRKWASRGRHAISPWGCFGPSSAVSGPHQEGPLYLKAVIHFQLADGFARSTIRSPVALSRAMLCKLKHGAVDAQSEARCPHVACDVLRHLRACWREADLRTSSVPGCWASIRYAQFAINSRFLGRMASLVSSRLGVACFRSQSRDEQVAVQWCERLQPACR